VNDQCCPEIVKFSSELPVAIRSVQVAFPNPTQARTEKKRHW